MRARKKYHDAFVRNQSMAAKGILKAANMAVANTGATPVTMTNLASAAWDASLATDGSLLGRARSMMIGVGRIGEKISHMSSVITESKNTPAPPPPPASRRRKLSEREEAYFQRVDNMVQGAGKGFKRRNKP